LCDDEDNGASGSYVGDASSRIANFAKYKLGLILTKIGCSVRVLRIKRVVKVKVAYLYIARWRMHGETDGAGQEGYKGNSMVKVEMQSYHITRLSLEKDTFLLIL